MRIRKSIAAVLAAAALTGLAACGVTDDTTTTTTTATSANSSVESGGGRGPGSEVATSDLTSEEQVVALIEQAYGDGGLDLHRGHQPIESVLNEVLQLSHDQLHARMEQGQNLAAVAEDVGVDPQELIEALVDSWSPAIDSAVANGAITAAEGEEYQQMLVDAFTFRVNWDGQSATPTVSAIDA